MNAPLSAMAESEWPPLAEEMREHLSSKIHAFEALETRMSDESLLEIDTKELWQVQGTKRVNGERVYVDLEDSFSWLDELVPLRVQGIFEFRGAYYFMFARPLIAGETTFDVTFFHGNTAGIPECSPSFAVADCGMCGNVLSDEWAITYDWEPIGLTDGLMDGQDATDAETYISLFREARDACESEGLSKMQSIGIEERKETE